MRTKLFAIFYMLFFAAIASAQYSIEDKQKSINAFITIASEYGNKAKIGTLTDEDLLKFKALFRASDSLQRSYLTGQDNLVIFRKLNRMRGFTFYTNVLLRLKKYDEVVTIAQDQFNLPDDDLIVDAKTAKDAHRYDTGNRINDQYDKIQTGGYIMQRADYLKAAGNLYSGYIIAARMTKNYPLMFELFEKSLKYGYFDNCEPIIQHNSASGILSRYNTVADYSPVFLQAVLMIKESEEQLTEKQKELSKESIEKNNQKIKEIFATALKQDVNTAEGITAFNTALKYQLLDKSISDAQKAQLIRNNIDQWILKEDKANHLWLIDSSIYTAVGYFITQELLNPQDKAFCDKFCSFISSHGITVINANPRLMYDCYLYYKKTEQKKLAKALYKNYLKEKFSDRFPA